jgi:ribonuclease P protein component
MLGQAHRLRRALFSSLEKGQKMANNRAFSLKKGPASTVRVGVTVSKKVAKSAVTRNTVRRRVYAVVRALMPKLKPGLYLIVAQRGAEKEKGAALEREISSLLL